MKDRVNLVFGFICYIISFLLIILYIFMEFSVFSMTSPLERLMVVLLVFILMYLACFMLYKVNKSKYFKLGKFNLWVLFVLYVIMLLNMTLFDSYFGRVSGNNYLVDYSNFDTRISLFTNFVPFDTIKNYFLALTNGNINVNVFIYNIFGNILAFMPLALFVTKLLPLIDKWYKYFIFSSIFIIFIELMQFVLNVGTMDIDDYILNILGTMLCYFFIRIKMIDRLINKVLYLNDKVL